LVINQILYKNIYFDLEIRGSVLPASLELGKGVLKTRVQLSLDKRGEAEVGQGALQNRFEQRWGAAVVASILQQRHQLQQQQTLDLAVQLAVTHPATLKNKHMVKKGSRKV